MNSFPFLQSLSLIFGAANQFLPEGKNKIVRTGVRNVLRTGNIDEQSNYDSEKRKTAQESSRKTKGRILRSLPVFLTVPPSKSRVVVGPNIQNDQISGEKKKGNTHTPFGNGLTGARRTRVQNLRIFNSRKRRGLPAYIKFRSFTLNQRVLPWSGVFRATTNVTNRDFFFRKKL